MKKQELIHLHGLLAEVSEYCTPEDDICIDLEDYHALGTRPTSIHLSKTDHKDAVFALVEGLTATRRDAPVETETEIETETASAAD